LETFDAENQASTLQFPSYALEGSVFQRCLLHAKQVFILILLDGDI